MLIVEKMAKCSVIALVLVAVVICSAAANNLILAPTATTLTTGQLRAEAALNTDSRYYWFAAGILQYELSAIRQQRPGLAAQNMIGIQTSFLPETAFNPAVAIGVRDAASQSSEGIGVYAVVTKHLPVGPASVLVKDFAATVGVGLFGIRGPFGGFEAKLPMNIFVQGEYDSHDFNGAVGWQPISLFRVKAYTIRKEFFLGAELVPMSF